MGGAYSNMNHSLQGLGTSDHGWLVDEAPELAYPILCLVPFPGSCSGWLAPRLAD